MKISYNWLKKFLSFEQTPSELSDILTNIGLEVEGVELVESIKGGLAGLLLGEVKTAEKHPNADRLKVTTVDVGQGNLLTIVCGAPNVTAGQKVVVAPVGSMVYPLNAEPFKINKSKIRGQVSEGMICAEDEIGLGESHDGIMVLPATATVGIAARTYFNVKDDYCFEIGLTPNRADALSHLGVARDIAAFLRKAYELPSLAELYIGKDEQLINVQVTAPESCLRYTSVQIDNIKIQSSPGWLVERLNAVGVRPINNVVDITNYVMLELGQPLHAFDVEKISGNQICVRQAVSNEKLLTLDGVERTLDSEDLLICDDQEPLGIAGVFGGKRSGVTEHTTSVFLESAYFHPVSIRKTAKRHGLKTDASFRYERGTDPEITLFALKRAAKLIQDYGGGRVRSGIQDWYPNPIKPFVFEVKYSYIHRLIGKEIPRSEIREIIIALGIKIRNEQEGLLLVEVPAFKVDVSRPVDLVEEILRIYGYNNVEIPKLLKASMSTFSNKSQHVIQDAIANFLVANGYIEILSNSLSKGNLVNDEKSAVKLLNPLSNDLSVMRQDMIYSGLEAISYNQKRKNYDLKLFEFGKTYHLLEDQYIERQHVTLLVSGLKERQQWNHDGTKVSFYDVKSAVDGVLQRLGISEWDIQDLDDRHFLYGLQYIKNGKPFVKFGEVNSADLKKIDVEGTVFYADFDWLMLSKLAARNQVKYKEVSKFPIVRRDLSLLLDDHVTFNALEKIAKKTDKKLIKRVNLFDVYKGNKLPVGKKSYALTFTLEDEEKTLNDKQIDAVIQKLIINFEKETGAEVRK